MGLTTEALANVLKQRGMKGRPKNQMPYKSEAQEKFFHSPKAAAQGISSDTVREFDEASAGKSLPEYAEKASGPKRPLPAHLRQRIAVRRALKK